MRIELSLLAMAALLAMPAHAADEPVSDHMEEHGGQIFHRFLLEADLGKSRGDTLGTWDFDGWIGGDENKLWLKSEGEKSGSVLEQAEFWALYSRNVAMFWDAQLGIRHDMQPVSTTYLVAGFEGLAQYFFETEAHLFLSEDGDLSARLRQENDLLLTQRLILQPYAEINLFAQDVPEQNIGAGFSSGEIGLQTRYEITRKFAPYLDLHYERKFGETSSLARNAGEKRSGFIASLGLRVMF